MTEMKKLQRKNGKNEGLREITNHLEDFPGVPFNYDFLD